MENIVVLHSLFAKLDGDDNHKMVGYTIFSMAAHYFLMMEIAMRFIGADSVANVAAQ